MCQTICCMANMKIQQWQQIVYFIWLQEQPHSTHSSENVTAVRLIESWGVYAFSPLIWASVWLWWRWGYITSEVTSWKVTEFLPKSLRKVALRINDLTKRPTWRGIYSQHQLAHHRHESNSSRCLLRPHGVEINFPHRDCLYYMFVSRKSDPFCIRLYVWGGLLHSNI